MVTLHTEEDEVSCPAGGDALDGGRADGIVASGDALDAETVGLNGIAVLAARDEHDVLAVPGERGAEIATDGSGSHDKHTHSDAPCAAPV